MKRMSIAPLVRAASGRLLVLALFSLTAQYGQGADALTLFKNYFVTGDYVVGGVGLRGQGVPNAATQAITGGVSSVSSYASGVIPMSGIPGYFSSIGGTPVPQNADIVAAYLYWQTIANPTMSVDMLSRGTFRGLKVVGTQVAPAGTMSCWGSGGGSGNQNGAQSLRAFRADVLRYLPYKKDPATGRPLGQRLVNDADLVANGLPLHTVSLPDSGGGGTQSPSSGNQAYLTEGVSLLVVYRVAGAPLRSVVIDDGGYTFSPVNPTMTQTVQGFYQASTTAPAGKMTHIVGDGDTSFQEHLSVNSAVPNGISSTNPFQGVLGSSWDNLTFDVSNLMAGNDASISTDVSPSGPSSLDCLSWSAIVFSTTVQDTDGDGLLDVWELSGLTDATDGSFVNLPAMGANYLVKDIFVEIDYMCSSLSMGACDTSVGTHSHLPTKGALDKVGDAFNARGIHIHFDVGGNYPGDPYVIPIAAGPRGGDAMPEVSCGAVQSPTCLYPAYPGTVSWKNGFRLLEWGGTSGGVPVAGHFDRNRKDIFRYALFAHTLGIPRWRANDKSLTNIFVTGGTGTVNLQVAHGFAGSFPITVVGAPVSSGLNGTYMATVATPTSLTFLTNAGTVANTYVNWGLSVSNGTPRSNSGVSDVGGADLMVTLGRWDNQVGSEFMQASTLLHELGHSLDLGHGGDISDPATCKPNYQSSMNYLFQVRGLLDTAGVPHIDYSDRALPTINEGSLNESPGLGAGSLPYLPRWYAPKLSSYLDTLLNTTPATKHCDGTPVVDGAQYVRVDGFSLAASPLDWNADGNTSGFNLAQDVNFNGAIALPATPGFPGFNDWLHLNLQQIGARRAAAGSSSDVVPGQDTGDDLGIVSGDLGIVSGDLGIVSGDLGIVSGDLGIVSGDLGIVSGDLGIVSGDLGIVSGDLGGELDFEGAISLGNAPNAFAAVVVGFNIDLTWTAPNVGSVTQYQVWRATCPKGATVTSPCSLSPSVRPAPLGYWTPGSVCDGSYNFCDTTAKNNVVYLYFVTTSLPRQSGPSNIVANSR